ncbi:hypothetical protein ACS0TY_028544 [Phlomoides rotata]
MFLAGKVEETPRPLKDVILVSYEIIHKKDPAAVQRIKQKEIYEQQKELILLGERVVLGTLGYDLNVHHPYKPLVEAIKKFKVAQNALAQVAWNFVNDGLRTSLCLQFKPHHIAAGAIFLAAKFLKVKLPSDGEKVWWQEFDVTPRQLEEVSNQMLELYEQQNRVPPSQASEAEASAGGNQRPPSKIPANEERGTSYSSSHGGSTSKGSSLKPVPSRPGPDEQNSDNHSGPPKITRARNNDYGSSENNSFPDRVGEDEINDLEEAVNRQGNLAETQNKRVEDDQEGNSGRIEQRDAGEVKDKLHGTSVSNKDVTVGQSPQDAKKKLDTEKLEKLKAAYVERKKARGDMSRKVDPMDELERELEDVEVPGEKRERKQSWSKPSRTDHENNRPVRYGSEEGDPHYQVTKEQSTHGDEFDNVEEGEVGVADGFDRGHRSPRSNRKRKPGSPLDRNRLGRLGYSERDHKRQLQENHV